MAIVISQGIFLWADLLTDLTGSGSDNGISTDQIAWAEDQSNWYYCVTVAASTSTWTALSGGGSAELGAAVEDTGATNPALMDATFTWQIAQTQSLTFENATSNNDLLILAPASGADVITLGHGYSVGAGDTVNVNSQTFTVNSTAITLEYATWPASDGVSGQTLTTNGAGALSWATGGSDSGIPGNIYDDLLFYMDAADRNSYPGSGTSVTDLMGNATSGTITNATFADGAFNFDAVSDDISFTKPAALDDIFAAGGTLMVWIRLADDGQAANGVILDTSDDADAGYTVSTVGASAGHVSIRFQRNWSGSTGGTWTTDTQEQPWTGSNDDVVHKGAWTSVAIQYSDTDSANQPTFYINGTAVTNTQNTSASGTAQSDSGNPITIGNIGTGLDRCLDGQIGVILLWDRTLNADEIQRAHSAFSARFGQGMRGGDGRLIGSGSFADISGQDIWIRGGDSHSTTNSEAEGGHIYIHAGDHLGGGNAAAGRIHIRSGDGGGNVTGSGDILIETGVSALGNALTIRQATLNTGNTPDPITIQGADNDGSGNAGAIFIRAGANTSAGDTAGAVTVRGGDGGDNGGTAIFGGAATFRAGDGVGRGGGDCTVRGGDGGSGNGGDMTMRGGDAQAGNGRGGRVFIDAGDGSGNGSGSTGGGNVEITAGSNITGNNITAGDVIITTGTNAGANFTGQGAGAFTVTTGNQSNSGSATNSPGGDATFTLGSSAKTATSSPGGSFTVTCGDGVANSANSRGGSVAMTGGDVTGTTAGAVAGGLTFTGGQATGAAGTSGSVTCAGGAAGFSGGTAGDFTGSGGAGNSSVGGDANLTGGGGSGANAGGIALIQGGSGGSTGSGGAAQVIGGTGGGSSGNGGVVNVDGGDASAGTNGDGGDVLVTGGSSDGTGTPGEITMTTDDTTAPVGIRTTSGFAGTECEHLTYGAQDTVTAGTTNQTVVTLGTLDTDGQNLKVMVDVTAVDDADDSNFIGFTYKQFFYRDGGTVSTIGAFDNQSAAVGPTNFPTDVSFNVAVSGNNILLRVTNGSSVDNYDLNIAVCWKRQEGGFSS